MFAFTLKPRRESSASLLMNAEALIRALANPDGLLSVFVRLSLNDVKFDALRRRCLWGNYLGLGNSR